MIHWKQANKIWYPKKKYKHTHASHEIPLSITNMVTVNSAILLTKWNTKQKYELKGNKFKVQTGNWALRSRSDIFSFYPPPPTLALLF